ncbi:hypothetical protein [Hymenobacter sp.]|uniref:hypothetical protein n=1 Tax=Hymenobacter sp. TaxID=1898978 RepID=UPI00286CE6FD|nr:hypothetical protein [Hymenobacter sp.]
MFLLRTVAVVFLFLAGAALPTRAAVGADPEAVEKIVTQLTGAAALSPAQLPAVRTATAAYVEALRPLARTRFASAAAASAAYTIVEFRYYRALQQVLSPAQLTAYQHLDDPLSLAATTRP